MTVKSPGRAPANDGELIRDLHDRLRVLESTKTTRVGSWVLQDIGGSLIATKPAETAAIAGAAVADAVKVDLGDLSSYVSQKDLDTVLKNFAGSLTGSATAPVGSNPLILEIQKWASGITGAISGVPSISGIVEAITGTLGDLADLATWALAIPAGVINGVLTAANIPGLDTAKIITGNFNASIINAGTFAAGLIPNLNAAIINAGTFAAGLIPGLDFSKIITGQLPAGLATWVAPIDTLMNAWGASGPGWSPADLLTAAQSIPNDAIAGLLGATNVGKTIQDFVDAGVQAVINAPGTVNNTLATWAGSLNSLANFLGFVTTGSAPQNSVAQITSFNNDLINARAIQKELSDNLDPTMDASFKLAEVNGPGATLPVMSVVQATPVSSYIRIRDGGIKQSISWLGYGLTNVVGFYLNLSHVDPVTGLLTPFYSTPNIVAGVGSGSVPVWNSINLAALDYINTDQGDLINVEFVIIGSGTYNIVGKVLNTQLPAHPTAVPQLPGATRLPATAVTFDAVGTAWNTSGQNNVNLSGSWSHTAAPDAYVIATVSCSPFTANSGVATINTPTYGGTPMTLLYTRPCYSANGYGQIGVFGIRDVAGGTRTIAASVSGTTALGRAGGNSVSYNNVGNVAHLHPNTGSNSTAPAHGVTNNLAGSRVVLCYGSGVTAGDTITGFSHTLRYLRPGTAANDQLILIGDSAATGSYNFTMSQIDSNTWGSISVVLAPKPSVEWTATGFGYTRASDAINVSGTWSHTANAGDAVVVAVNATAAATTAIAGSHTRTVTYGGVPMTSLGVTQLGATNYGFIELFGLLDVAGGAKTVALTITGPATFRNVAANSVSYKNVGAFGVYNGYAAAASSTGSNWITVGPLLADVRNAVVNAIGTISGATTGALSNYIRDVGRNPNQRVLSNLTTSGWTSGFLLGDSPGETGQFYTTATQGAANSYSNVYIPLIAKPAVPSTAVPTPSSNTPWVGLSGSAGITQFSPVITPMMDLGSSAYSPPTWANYFDVAIWGDGGGGMGGAPFFGGWAGSPGGTNQITLTKAQISGAAWTWTNNQNGAAGAAPSGPGAGGAGSSVTIPGYGVLSASGGAGSGGTPVAGAPGMAGGGSAGITIVDAHGQSTYYPGGAGGGGPQGSGGQPGGAGSGGNANYIGTYVHGGWGGASGGYIRAYQ